MQSKLPLNLTNNILIIIIAIIVAAYASQVRIKLPNYINKLFRNNLFRFLFLSLLMIYSFEKSPHVAISIALIFVLVMNAINCDETIENFKYLKKNKNKK
jgi:hypothetical membrane protein